MKLLSTLAIAATAVILTVGTAQAHGHGHRHGHRHGQHHGHGAMGHSHNRHFRFPSTNCVIKHRWNHHHRVTVRFCYPTHS